jgi:hypothetical protein
MDPAFQLDADPDPAFHIDADSDLNPYKSFCFDADPDPFFNLKTRICRSGLQTLHGSGVSLLQGEPAHDSIMSHYSSRLFHCDDLDPNPASQHDADLYQS